MDIFSMFNGITDSSGTLIVPHKCVLLFIKQKSLCLMISFFLENNAFYSKSEIGYLVASLPSIFLEGQRIGCQSFMWREQNRSPWGRLITDDPTITPSHTSATHREWIMELGRPSIAIDSTCNNCTFSYSLSIRVMISSSLIFVYRLLQRTQPEEFGRRIVRLGICCY